MTYTRDREITPWLPPLPSGSRSAVRAPRMPDTGASHTWNHQATQTSWDRRPGEDRPRYNAHASLYPTAPRV